MKKFFLAIVISFTFSACATQKAYIPYSSIYENKRQSTVMVEIPGMNWKGDNTQPGQFGDLLQSDKYIIQIRHYEGLERAGQAHWDTPSPNTHVVYLPYKFNEKIGNDYLKSHLEAAYAQGKDVLIQIDKNVGYGKQLAGMDWSRWIPGPRSLLQPYNYAADAFMGSTHEDKLSAGIADYISYNTPANFNMVLGCHSNGCKTLAHMNDFGRYSMFALRSPMLENFDFTQRVPGRTPIAIVTSTADFDQALWNNWGTLSSSPNVIIFRQQAFTKADLGIGGHLATNNLFTTNLQTFNRARLIEYDRYLNLGSQIKPMMNEAAQNYYKASVNLAPNSWAKFQDFQQKKNTIEFETSILNPDQWKNINKLTTYGYGQGYSGLKVINPNIAPWTAEQQLKTMNYNHLNNHLNFK